MDDLRKILKSKPPVAIYVPLLLSFIAFTMQFITTVCSGHMSTDDMNQLMKNADGFETVVMLCIMLVLKNKKK